MYILLKISSLLLFITCATSYTERIPVGVILKKDEHKVIETVINYVSWNQRTNDGQSQFVIDIIKDNVEEEDAVHYQQSICRLLKKGIMVLLAPSTCSVCFSVLATTSNEFKIPLISQELPEFPLDVSPKYAVGIRPGTTRAILDLVRYYHWQDIVYMYDH
ncbi:Glutamate receptor 1, partial [Stegodyphus mimosarum]